MINCAQFLMGIGEINFTGTGAGKIREEVYASVLEELRMQEKILQQNIETMKPVFKAEWDDSTPESVKNDKEKLQKALETVQAKIEELNKLNVAKILTLDDKFVVQFASYFRDLRHLAITLSDAPPSIKAKQTELYVSILSKLSKEDQEKQLATLSNEQLSDLVEEAIGAYESQGDTSKKKALYQAIAHQAIFQLVHRNCEDEKKNDSKGHVEYQNFLNKINHLNLINNMNKSSILDNLSDYQSSVGQSIASQVDSVKSYHELKDIDLLKDHPEIVLSERAFFHSCRFGQEDRREYAQRRKENVQRDFFWARDLDLIRKLSMTSSSEDHLKRLYERKYLIHAIERGKYKEVGGSRERSTQCLYEDDMKKYLPSQAIPPNLHRNTPVKTPELPTRTLKKLSLDGLEKSQKSNAPLENLDDDAIDHVSLPDKRSLAAKALLRLEKVVDRMYLDLMNQMFADIETKISLKKCNSMFASLKGQFIGEIDKIETDKAIKQNLKNELNYCKNYSDFKNFFKKMKFTDMGYCKHIFRAFSSRLFDQRGQDKSGNIIWIKAEAKEQKIAQEILRLKPDIIKASFQKAWKDEFSTPVIDKNKKNEKIFDVTLSRGDLDKMLIGLEKYYEQGFTTSGGGVQRDCIVLHGCDATIQKAIEAFSESESHDEAKKTFAEQREQARLQAITDSKFDSKQTDKNVKLIDQQTKELTDQLRRQKYKEIYGSFASQTFIGASLTEVKAQVRKENRAAVLNARDFDVIELAEEQKFALRDALSLLETENIEDDIWQGYMEDLSDSNDETKDLIDCIKTNNAELVNQATIAVEALAALTAIETLDQLINRSDLDREERARRDEKVKSILLSLDVSIANYFSNKLSVVNPLKEKLKVFSQKLGIDFSTNYPTLSDAFKQKLKNLNTSKPQVQVKLTSTDVGRELLQKALKITDALMPTPEEVEEDILKKKKETWSIASINNVLDQITTKSIRQIVGTSAEQELLLRKLLALHVITPYVGVKFLNFKALNKAFDELTKAEPIQALAIPDLTKDVEEAFAILANESNKIEVQTSLKDHLEGMKSAGYGLDERVLEKNRVEDILEIAETLSASDRERKERANELSGYLEDTSREKNIRINAIATLYTKEYMEMANEDPMTVRMTARTDRGLSSPRPGTARGQQRTTLEERMIDSIKVMATDLVNLVDRVRDGKPALTENEEKEYIGVMQLILKNIPADKSLNDYHFTVPHSVTGEQKITLIPNKSTDVPKEVKLNLGAPLPYTMIKSPDSSDVMFSYGGVRGVIGAYQEFDRAYAQIRTDRPRFFERCRLLGEGQYGSVQAVESFLTGMNAALKEGIIAEHMSESHKLLLKNPRTRPLVSKPDKHSRIERDALKALAQASEGRQETTGYWEEEHKHAKQGDWVSYHLLMDRAKGKTYADYVNPQMGIYPKNSTSYHLPWMREGQDKVQEIEFRLELSESIAKEVERLHDLGFVHNDIKPENFLYKQLSDGRIVVKFIDWATAAYERVYKGKEDNLSNIAKEVFGPEANIDDWFEYRKEPPHKIDRDGRFVKKMPDGSFKYGIDANLQILHGDNRNCTLAYLSHKLLRDDNNELRKCLGAGKTDDDYSTRVDSTDKSLDNYATTAMTFGVGSPFAYFSIAKGRTVGDYVIPGVIDLDSKNLDQLQIENFKLFNEMFISGEPKPNTMDDIYNIKNEYLMFLPGNTREGQPLHLYGYLDVIRKELSEKSNITEIEKQLASDIDAVLKAVRDSIVSGEGLSTQQLIVQKEKATRCISTFKQLDDPEFMIRAQQDAQIKGVLDEFSGKHHIHMDDLLKSTANKEHPYPKWQVLLNAPEGERDKVSQIFKTAISSIGILQDKCILGTSVTGEAPTQPSCSDLLKVAIEHNQADLVKSLLELISKSDRKADWVELIKEQGLLHYAFQQGMTDVVEAIITTLNALDVKDENLFNLMMKEYGPEKQQIHGQEHIGWAINALHYAILNNDSKQLDLVLKALPEAALENNKEKLYKAISYSAFIIKPDSFNAILNAFNALLDKSKKLESKDIVALRGSNNYSPYHWFLRDKKTAVDIVIPAIKNLDAPKQKEFLNGESYPALIALKNGDDKTYFEFMKMISSWNAADQRSFFAQKDDEGKNVLNYLLEQGKFKIVREFIPKVISNVSDAETRLEVITSLLTSPAPLNPLRNFLNGSDVVNDKFDYLTLFCDALSENAVEKPTDLTIKQEKSRLIALLINQDWLIEQANVETPSEQLQKLMKSDGLSAPQKVLLYQWVRDAASNDKEKNKNAISFYQDLYNAYQPKTKEAADQAHIQMDLLKYLGERVAKVTDASTVSRTELAERERGYKTKVGELESTVGQQVHDLSRARGDIERLKNSSNELDKILTETKTSLDASKNNAAKLDKDIVELNRAHKETISAMGRDFAEREKEAKAQNEAAVSVVQKLRDEAIAQAETTHSRVLGEKASELSKFERKNKILSDNLGHTEKELSEKNDGIAKLTAQLAALTTARDSLQRRYDASGVENEGLKQSLDEQRVASEAATKAAAVVQAALDNSTKEATELRDELRRSRKDNTSLRGAIGVLEETVLQQLEEISAVQGALERLKTSSDGLNDNLKKERALLDESKTTSVRLEEDIEALKRDHAEQIAEINRAFTARESEASSKSTEAVAEVVRERDAAIEQAKSDHSQKLGVKVSALEEVERNYKDLSDDFRRNQQELSEKKDTIDRLTGELDSLKTASISLQGRFDESGVENESLKQSLAKQKFEAVEAEKAAAAVRAYLEKSTKEATGLQDELHRSKQDNIALRGKVGELEESAKQQSVELADARGEISRLQQSAIALDVDLVDTKRSLDASKVAAAKLDSDIVQLKLIHRAEMEKMVRDFAAREVEASKISEDNVAAVQRSRDESITKAKYDHARELAAKVYDLVVVKRKNDDLSDKLSRAEKDLAVKNNRVSELTDEIGALKAAGEDLSSRLDASGIANKSLTRSLEGQKEATADAVKAAAAVQATLDNSTKEATGLRAELQRSGEENKKLIAQVGGLEKTVSSLSSENAVINLLAKEANVRANLQLDLMLNFQDVLVTGYQNLLKASSHEFTEKEQVLTSRLQESSDKLEESNTVLQLFKTRVSKLTDEIKKLTEELKVAGEGKNKAEAKALVSDEEKSITKSRLENARCELEHASKQCADAKDRRNKVSAEKTGLQKQIDALKKRKDGLKKQLETQEKSSEKRAKETQEYTKKNKTQLEDLSRKLQEKDKLSQESSRGFRTALEEKKRDLDRLKQSEKDKSAIVALLERQLDELQNKNTRLTSSSASMSKEFDSKKQLLEDQIATQKDAMADLEAKIEQLTSTQTRVPEISDNNSVDEAASKTDRSPETRSSLNLYATPEGNDPKKTEVIPPISSSATLNRSMPNEGGTTPGVTGDKDATQPAATASAARTGSQEQQTVETYIYGAKVVGSSSHSSFVADPKYNIDQHLLNKDESEDFTKKGGVTVSSSSGQDYSFSNYRRSPRAVLPKDALIGKEYNSPKAKSLAITVMNMIDNIVAKAGKVHINTMDPFVAAVARKHIDDIGKTKKWVKDSSKVNCLNKLTETEVLVVDKLFSDIVSEVSEEEKNENRPLWDKECEEHKNPTKLFRKETQSIRDGGPTPPPTTVSGDKRTLSGKQ